MREEITMNREVCKFMSGSFAALAYAHAGYAVATSRGLVNEPVFLGRSWGVGTMWAEAAIYSAASLVLGYLGWASNADEQRQQPTPPSADEPKMQPESRLVSP